MRTEIYITEEAEIKANENTSAEEADEAIRSMRVVRRMLRHWVPPDELNPDTPQEYREAKIAG